jgi:dTDP-4-amino-4,6-dideoxygalactose transaminase
MQIPFHRYSFDNQELEAAERVLRSGWITTGKETAQFEKEFAKYKNVPCAVAVNSCTAALFLLLSSLKLKPEDEVITTPLSFVATANVVLHHQAKLVFADINPETLNIDIQSIKENTTSRTRAIIVVHVAGHPCDMKPIMEWANAHQIAVIEDCAHAIEATYENQPVGTFGLGGAFSFYATKNITTAEGGILISKTIEHEKLWRSLRNHGFDLEPIQRQENNGFKQYDIVWAGYKMNMTDLAAAIGRVQLSKISHFRKKRLKIVQKYLDFFANFSYLKPILPLSNSESAWHLMIIKNQSDLPREKILQKLINQGIQPSIHFQPIYDFSFYRNLGYKADRYPHCEQIKNQIFSLPLYPDLTDAQLEYIFENLQSIVK